MYPFDTNCKQSEQVKNIPFLETQSFNYITFVQQIIRYASKQVQYANKLMPLVYVHV